MVDKLKKHSPTQTETEQSIIDQVPPEKMGEFIRGLVELGRARKAAQEPQQGNPEVQPSQPRKEINRGPILRKYDA